MVGVDDDGDRQPRRPEQVEQVRRNPVGEDDGLVVRIVGMGVPMETVLQVAAASRELDDDEWAAVVEADA